MNDDRKQHGVDSADPQNWSRGYKTFFMLSSAETKIYPADKCISRINYQILRYEPEFSTNFDYFSIYEQLKFHTQMS